MSRVLGEGPGSVQSFLPTPFLAVSSPEAT